MITLCHRCRSDKIGPSTTLRYQKRPKPQEPPWLYREHTVGKYDCITSVLRDLHWLPVRQRLILKLAMTVFKYIHSLEPSYLASDCVLASSVAVRRHLRSANARTPVLRRTKTAIDTRVCCFRCCRMKQFTLELRILSCSVQTFAKRL